MILVQKMDGLLKDNCQPSCFRSPVLQGRRLEISQIMNSLYDLVYDAVEKISTDDRH